jgi:hypothetical protein
MFLQRGEEFCGTEISVDVLEVKMKRKIVLDPN